ncbi:MAG: hypothetical protein ACOCRX_09385 [Candidatus Woesearchaeota archaeon]
MGNVVGGEQMSSFFYVSMCEIIFFLIHLKKKGIVDGFKNKRTSI